MGVDHLMPTAVGPTMSSREIAEDLGKRHSEVIADIRRMLDEGRYPPSERPAGSVKAKPKADVVWHRFGINWAAKPGRSRSYESTYIDECTGSECIELLLPKDEATCLWTLYDHLFSARIIERFRLTRQAVAERAAPPPPTRGGAADKVYFIGSSNGSIKIGFAKNPRARLAALQTGHPDQLSLLAVTTGGIVREKQYHREFAAHRLAGEWFAPHLEILAEIDRLNAVSSEELA